MIAPWNFPPEKKNLVLLGHFWSMLGSHKVEQLSFVERCYSSRKRLDPSRSTHVEVN